MMGMGVTVSSRFVVHYSVPLCSLSILIIWVSFLQLHKYEECYGEALEGFSQAAALDPAWPEPQQREQQLLEFLSRLTSLLENKVKTRKG